LVLSVELVLAVRQSSDTFHVTGPRV
jgi:hypothetical protein